MNTRTAVAPNLLWPLQEVLGDLRVQYGIKLGLAVLLALYCAEALRLEHPNWAILTVLTMMSVRYVGSIATIAITQVAGAIAGALIEIWLVGDYASTPVIFLVLFFFVIAFAGYKFGQFPASQVPFAYFLAGLSAIFCDHIRRCGSFSGLADRLEPGVGDSRWRHERASRNDSVVAPLVQALQTLATRTTGLVSRRHILPEIAQAMLQPQFERLESEFKKVLDIFAKCLRQGDCRRELPSLHCALGQMDGALESMDQREILEGRQLDIPLRVLELVDHYHATGEALEECTRLIGTLKIHRYWGHCGL
jgi:hypothetical protein